MCVGDMAGGLVNVFRHSGSTPLRRTLSVAGAAGEADASSLVADYANHCCQVLQQL